MRHTLILGLMVLCATVAGCAKPEPTYPDAIPAIPPGRSSPEKGDGGPAGESGAGGVPKPPG